MIPNILVQVQKSDKNTEIRFLNGDKMFYGDGSGRLREVSLIENKTVHDYGNIFNYIITSMAKTPDNKSQFMCCGRGCFKELDISARKQINSFNVKSAKYCVVSHDNKSLITAEDGQNCLLTKWSIRSKKQLYTWKSGGKVHVESQSVSYNNRYQLIGYTRGWLGIFNLQKHKTLKNIQVMSNEILSVIFSRDNQRAFISEWSGNIKIIKWQTDANSGGDFDFTEEAKEVGNYYTCSICLTKDEKYLLVGSYMSVRVFETATRKITKEFQVTYYVAGISLIKDGKKAIIAQINGNLTILDLKTLEISSAALNITNGKGLRIVTVI